MRSTPHPHPSRVAAAYSAVPRRRSAFIPSNCAKHLPRQECKKGHRALFPQRYPISGATGRTAASWSRYPAVCDSTRVERRAVAAHLRSPSRRLAYRYYFVAFPAQPASRRSGRELVVGGLRHHFLHQVILPGTARVKGTIKGRHFSGPSSSCSTFVHPTASRAVGVAAAISFARSSRSLATYSAVFPKMVTLWGPGVFLSARSLAQ